MAGREATGERREAIFLEKAARKKFPVLVFIFLKTEKKSMSDRFVRWPSFFLIEHRRRHSFVHLRGQTTFDATQKSFEPIAA